jgi:hypothetical protein
METGSGEHVIFVALTSFRGLQISPAIQVAYPPEAGPWPWATFPILNQPLDEGRRCLQNKTEAITNRTTQRHTPEYHSIID